MSELASESSGSVLKLMAAPERSGGDDMSELASESFSSVLNSWRRRSEAEVTA
ncbi:hypothetical protein GCM10010112_39260 [Actinoplanes lobatus]|nr:hypothetical protein GCM10010112_39260 [Actinoplanes lobatus]